MQCPHISDSVVFGLPLLLRRPPCAHVQEGVSSAHRTGRRLFQVTTSVVLELYELHGNSWDNSLGPAYIQYNPNI